MNIFELASMLQHRRTAIFCGAGISRQAGVPLASEIETSVLTALDVVSEHIVNYASEHVPFEVTMEVLLTNSDSNKIFSLFEDRSPSRNHRLIARLAKAGYVKIIITTNFDTCIEQALDEQHVPYCKVFTNQELEELKPNEDILLIKLHGCISSRIDLSTTIRAVANERAIKSRSDALTNVLSGGTCDSLLVLGYSFSDKFDINPAFITHRFPISVFIVDHVDNQTNAGYRIPLSTLSPKHPLAGYDGLQIKENTDILIQGLWQEFFNDPVPPLQVQDPRLALKLSTWRASLIERGKGICSLIAALLFKSANLNRISNEYAEKALSMVEQDSMPLEASIAWQTLGDNYRDLQENDKAPECFQRALKIAHKGNRTDLKARAITSYGVVLEDLAKAKDREEESDTPHAERKRAIAYYKLGMTWAKQVGNDELVGKCEGNIGIALKNVKAQEYRREAIRHLIRALRVARSIGDKRSEGRYYGSIGSALSLLGKRRWAIRFFEHAREIAEDLSDSRHVAIWTANIGEDYVAITPDIAITYLESAIELFSSLDNPGYVKYCRDLLTVAKGKKSTINAQSGKERFFSSPPHTPHSMQVRTGRFPVSFKRHFQIPLGAGYKLSAD